MRRGIGYVLVAVGVALLIRAVRPIGGDCITNAAISGFAISVVGIALIYVK
jgi:hypothetical protein